MRVATTEADWIKPLRTFVPDVGPGDRLLEIFPKGLGDEEGGEVMILPMFPFEITRPDEIGDNAADGGA
jgi:hypothetical protein